MDDRFSASYLKIARAKRHLDELEGAVSKWLATEPVKITSTIEEGRIGFQMKSEPVPAEVSAILGDVFHNLRSSLDLMAAELCGKPGSPDLDVFFPFSSEEGRFDEAIKRSRFDRSGAEAVELLKSWKPYRGGNQLLRAIHDLNIMDKHKTLIARPMSFSTPIIDTRPPGGGLALVGDPNKPSEIKLLFPPDCEMDKEELIPTLHELVSLAEQVIASFKGKKCG